jgi:transposase
MLALEPRVVDAVWAAIEPLLPERPADRHPLGCHRPRIPDRQCFEAILFRLVTGCSWDVAGRLGKGGETTLRTRWNAWIDAGVSEALVEEALEAYDRVIGLDLDDVALDGSAHKAPCGGEGTGPNPFDRFKTGWKWSLAVEGDGIPIGWVVAPAHRNDAALLDDTLATIARRGLTDEIGSVHLDRGYDNPAIDRLAVEWDLDFQIARRNRPGQGRRPLMPLGLRWSVERTNSWLSNFGQLRRNTDRTSKQRRAALALAIALVIAVKLVKWAQRWHR